VVALYLVVNVAVVVSDVAGVLVYHHLFRSDSQIACT